MEINADITGATELLGGFEDILGGMGTTATWVVGTNVHYSIYVEFGTSRMAAQPYLRPAVEDAKRNSKQIWKRSKGVDDFVAQLALYIENHAKRRCPVDTGNLRASIRAEQVS